MLIMGVCLMPLTLQPAYAILCVMQITLDNEPGKGA